MKKYTLIEFVKKYEGKRKISCGINYADGTHDTILSSSFSQIISYIKQQEKEISFICSR